MTGMQVSYSVIVVAIFLLKAVDCGDHPDGVSKVSRSQDALGNYHFSYTVNNGEGEQFRQEGTDELGRVIGSYGLTHVDGTHRVVDYVADKDGFRAEVRSNEPGVASAESADASIARTDHLSPSLTVAATSNGDTRQSFGKRLKTGTSRVAYVAPASDTATDEGTPDESVRESRQRNFDDYRPLNPVAYYPTDVRGPLNSAAQRPNDQSRLPRVLAQSPEAALKPLDVYFPPIDPHSAMRRPSDYVPRRQSDGNFFPTTTSRRPFLPPYGGFDDDPLPMNRRPGISAPSIPGGLGPGRDQSQPAPTPGYGIVRYPSGGDIPDRRDFSLPRFPPLRPGFQSSIQQRHNNGFPSFPQPLTPGVLFNPPSYEGGIGTPNFVLRAVPIPNGIQAVRVDPTSGRVYERLVYPLYLRHDGHPAYDRNILLHNDDVSDDDTTRNDNSGYYDVSYPSRVYRGARDDDVDRRDQSGQYNGSYDIDEKSLSEPTAKDIELIYRQLSMVEGFDRDRFSSAILQGGSPFRNSESDQEDRQRNGSPRLRSQTGQSLFGEYSNGDAFSRNPRHSDQLVPEDSKAVSSNLEESASNVKQIETEGKSSEVEKEGE